MLWGERLGACFGAAKTNSQKEATTRSFDAPIPTALEWDNTIVAIEMKKAKWLMAVLAPEFEDVKGPAGRVDAHSRARTIGFWPPSP